MLCPSMVEPATPTSNLPKPWRSDVACEYPLSDMLQFHKARDAEATLLVTKVDDPSKYGVVIINEKGQVCPS